VTGAEALTVSGVRCRENRLHASILRADQLCRGSRFGFLRVALLSAVRARPSPVSMSWGWSFTQCPNVDRWLRRDKGWLVGGYSRRRCATAARRHDRYRSALRLSTAAAHPSV